jgi:K+-sensing histidine kinase KdpD
MVVADGLLQEIRRRAGRLVFEVWGSGPGIPENQRENIFREFYQVAATEAAGRRGGLGHTARKVLADRKVLYGWQTNEKETS